LQVNDIEVRLDTAPIIPPTPVPTILPQASRELTVRLHSFTSELKRIENEFGDLKISSSWRNAISEVLSKVIARGIDINFLDSSGIQWHRSARGQLKEIT
jgi:hypothetical protein